MTFLEYIDELYLDACKRFEIPKKPIVTFRWFVPIEPQKWDVVSHFLISKQEKSKLLILDGKQRVYLSDLQVVKTILEMEEEDQKWFLAQFIKLYGGEYTSFFFKIESKIFEGNGMCRYPTKKVIKLFSDSNIDINDFVFLVNFIVNKDICWGEKIKNSDFYRRTLRKYICLTDFYAVNQQRSKPFLESIGYPVDLKEPVDEYKNNASFKQIEKFDISLYK